MRSVDLLLLITKRFYLDDGAEHPRGRRIR